MLLKGFSCQGMLQLGLCASLIDFILRVRWWKGCNVHMYASIKALAVKVCLCKECSFHMYVYIKDSVVRICSYKAGMLL